MHSFMLVVSDKLFTQSNIPPDKIFALPSTTKDEINTLAFIFVRNCGKLDTCLRITTMIRNCLILVKTAVILYKFEIHAELTLRLFRDFYSLQIL